MRCILLAIALFGVARADEDLQKAKSHYQHGTKLYDLQRYAEAAKEYEAAFELRDDPVLLFNIGQAYRFAGENQKALGAFRSYLRRLPRASNRPEVEARIADLQRLIEEQKRSQEAPPSGPIPVEPKPVPEDHPQSETRPALAVQAPPPLKDVKAGQSKRIAGLTVGAVGVAAVVLGIAFEGLASSANHDLSNPAANTRFDPSLEERMRLDQTLGATFFAIGGAAVVVGTVLYVVGRREKTRAMAFVPSVSRGLFAAELQLNF